MKRGHWITALVALGAGLMWFAVAQSNPAAPPPAENIADAPSPPATAPVVQEPADPEPAEPEAPKTAEPPSQPAASTGEPATAPTPEGPHAPERSGPVDALEHAFASEPRASSAVPVESAIEEIFRRPEAPRELLKSVQCRSTVCRIETRWSKERAQGFMFAFMRLVTLPQEQHAFDHELGVDPQGEPDADGSRAINVYVKYSDR